jgi:hypothetical protein
MVENPIEPTFDFRDWFDGGNIFFRGKDKQRFHFALEAITDRGLGLAVIGDNEVVLDHYYRMMLAKLRERRDFDVEVMLPASTENLLQRFIEMVEAMTIEEARQPAAKDSSTKLLIINDAKLVESSQWALLERLLADFPGINARVILFIDRSYNASYEEALSVFGRKLHRWVSETPSDDEVKLLIEAADEHGFSSEVRDLMDKAGISVLDQDPHQVSLVEIQDDFDNAVSKAQIDDENLKADRAGSSVNKNILVIISIFVIFFVLGVVALNYSEISDTIKSELKELNSKPQDVADIEVGLTPDKDERIPKDENLTDVLVIDDSPIESDTVITDGAPAVIDEVPPVIAKNRPSPQPVESEMSAANSESLINSANPASFFVQHVVLSSKDEVVQFASQYPDLGSNLVIALNKNKTKFALISGPYDSKLEASASMKERNLPDTFWIRSASGLQSVLKGI